MVDQRIGSYMSWQGLSMLMQAMTQLGVMALLARFLSAEDFGLVAAANIAITLVQMIAEGGISSAIVQRPLIDRTFIGSAISVSLIVGAICYLALVAMAFPFQYFYGMENLGLVVLVLGGSSLLTGMSSVLEGLLQRELRFDQLFRVNFASWGPGFAVPAIILAVAGAGVWAIVIATLVRAGTKLIMLAWQCNGSLRPRWQAAAVRDLLHFGFGLTQDRFWNWSAAQVVPFAIGYLFGQEKLGQFYVANQLAVLPAQHLSSIVSVVYFPILSRALGENKAIIGQFFSALTTLLVAVTALGLILALNAAFAISIVLGEGWGDAVAPFAVLCLGAGIRSGIQLCDSLNIARGAVYALANRRAITAGVMLAVMYLARDTGLAGAAWGIIIGNSVMLILTVVLAVTGLRVDRVTRWLFLKRTILALGLIVTVDVAVLYLREASNLSGVMLLTVSMAANTILVIPVALILLDRVRLLVRQRAGIHTPRKGASQ